MVETVETINTFTFSDLLVDSAGGTNYVANDDILPSQFFSKKLSKTIEGETKLLVAVLWDAIKCARLGVESFNKPNNIHNINLMNKALQWIEGYPPKDTNCFTFNYICEGLEMDSSWLRKQIYGFLFSSVVPNNNYPRVRAGFTGNHIVAIKSGEKKI